MTKIISFITAIFFSFSLFSQNATIKAVHDGDSFKVKFDSIDEPIYIRLYVVDCPEVRSNYIRRDQVDGRMVADAMRTLLRGQRVTVDTLYRDMYNRPVAKVYLNGLDISEYVLSMGYGWYTPEGNKDVDKKYNKAYLAARKKDVGIWSNGATPMKPSTFRKRNKY